MSRMEFRVSITEKIWSKWLRHNGEFAKAGADVADPGQSPDAAIMEALLATALTNEIRTIGRGPLVDTSTSIMLAVGHVRVEAIEPETP